MFEEPENIVLKQLSLLRADVGALTEQVHADMSAMKEEINHKMGSLAQTLVAIQRDIRGLQRDVVFFKDSIATMGIAVDEHTAPLDRIEKRLGLVDA